MGFTDFAQLFRTGHASVLVPPALIPARNNIDSSKSDGLIRADDGHVLFRDFGYADAHFTLGQMMCSMVTGTPGILHKVSLATWSMRLLIESGVISPATVTLPSFTGTPAEMKFYNGVALLFQCRWRYAPHKGEPIMMAREFMAGWCGVGITKAHDTKNKLVKLKVLRQYNSKRRGFLFTPYEE